jgi:hypothetical protein
LGLRQLVWPGHVRGSFQSALQVSSGAQYCIPGMIQRAVRWVGLQKIGYLPGFGCQLLQVGPLVVLGAAAMRRLAGFNRAFACVSAQRNGGLLQRVSVQDFVAVVFCPHRCRYQAGEYNRQRYHNGLDHLFFITRIGPGSMTRRHFVLFQVYAVIYRASQPFKQ